MHVQSRRRMQINGRVLAWSLLAALASGCAATNGAHSLPAESAKPAPPPPGDLRVGMCFDYPPLVLKQNDKPAGAEVDFAGKLGAAMKRRIRIIELKRDDLIPALRDGRIDVIMAGMSVTEERERLVSFAEPYLHVGQMALIRKADEAKLQNREAIDQPRTRIGFQNHTTGDDFVRSKVTQAKLVGFATVDQGITALRNKKIDILVHDAPTIWRVTGGFGSKEKQLIGRFQLLTDEPLAWAVRREDSALRHDLDRLVKQWEDNGELEEVLARWIPVRKLKVPLPAAGSK